MMTLRSCLCYSCLCFGAALGTLAAPHAAQAAPPPDTPAAARAGIQAAYDGINAAFARRDLGRFMSYFAPDYTDTDVQGHTLTRDQARRQCQAQLGQIKTLQTHYTIQGLAPAPGGDLVRMAMHTDGTGEKKVLFMRLRGTFTNDLQVRDLWVDTPQGWLLKHRQTLQDETHTRPG